MDPLTDVSPPDTLWSRVNTAEAAPGVLTAMAWSFFGPITEVNVRRGFADLGVIPDAEAVGHADAGVRMLGVFHGRYTLNVSVLRSLMAGLPGVTGDDVERDVLGSSRPGIVDASHGNRLPAVLARLPGTLVRGRGAAGRYRLDVEAWWGAVVGPEGVRANQDPRAVFLQAIERFGYAIRLQGRARLTYQAVSSAVAGLAARAGDPALASTLMAGAAGLDESMVADDLHALAHDRIDLQTFVARHGYHGPNVGDIATRSWREASAPVERLLPHLRSVAAPSERRAAAARRRDGVVAAMVRALPAARRPDAAVLLRLGPAAVRTLERCKIAHLIALDGARGAVRSLGATLVGAGHLEHPDDAFHLLVEELLAHPAADLAELVGERREQHAAHRAVGLPETWIGQPDPFPVERGAARSDVLQVTGDPGSPGVVEGVVRVVADAADDVDVEPGEVLVCPVTDPSWVSLMTVAGALVIDIGGPASHGAIVARELGVPCVIGTRTGTRDLRNGDLVRVDGGAGTVEVLAR